MTRQHLALEVVVGLERGAAVHENGRLRGHAGDDVLDGKAELLDGGRDNRVHSPACTCRSGRYWASFW